MKKNENDSWFVSSFFADAELQFIGISFNLSPEGWDRLQDKKWYPKLRKFIRKWQDIQRQEGETHA